MEKTIISNIRIELQKNSDAKTKESAHHFFKEKVKFYGVKSAIVSQIARKYAGIIKKEKKEDIFSLCEELLKSDYSEEAFIAFEFSYRQQKYFEEKDILLFEKWLNKYINNWAKCDVFCNHTVGSFIMKFPKYLKKLKDWTKSENRWVRRASAVTLIVPAKKGMFLKDIFEIADSLLTDKDDLVQKGYGWMLKAASQAHQKEVFNYVMENKKQMPRTALRYAIEKMPQDLKKKAMERY